MLTPDTPVTPSWTPARFVNWNEPLLHRGVDLRQFLWRALDEDDPERVIVAAHPQYPQQRHSMGVRVAQTSPPIRFAYGETAAVAGQAPTNRPDVARN